MKKLLSLAAVLAVTSMSMLNAGTVTKGEAIAVTDKDGKLVSLAFNPKNVQMAITKEAHKKGKGATMFGLDDVLNMGKGFLSNPQFQGIAAAVASKGFEAGAQLLQNKEVVGAVVNAAATAATAAAPALGNAMEGKGDLVGQGVKLGMDNAPKAVDAVSGLVR